MSLTVDPPGGEDSRIDGRRLRRDRNKDLVLDQVIRLFVEGNLSPSLSEVAEAAGVSLRSIYRYFEYPDQLTFEAIDRYVTQSGQVPGLCRLGQGTTSEKIDNYFEACVSVHRVDAAVNRAAQIAGVENPLVWEILDAKRRTTEAMLIEHFADELAGLDGRSREIAIEAMLLVCQIENLEHTLGRNPNDTQMVRSVGRLLLMAAFNRELLKMVTDDTF